jgi:hypothetical protein
MRRFSILLGLFLLAYSFVFYGYSTVRRWMGDNGPPIFDFGYETWYYYAEIASRFALPLSYALVTLALLIPRRRSAKWRSQALPIVRRGPLRQMHRAIRPALLLVGIGALVSIYMVFDDDMLGDGRFLSAPWANTLWLLLILGVLYLSIFGFILTLRMSQRRAEAVISGKTRVPDHDFEFGRRAYTYRRIGWITGLATLASTEAMKHLLPYLYLRFFATGAHWEELWSFWKLVMALHFAALSFLCLKLFFWKRRKRRVV